jgi:hypothetical protein
MSGGGNNKGGSGDLQQLPYSENKQAPAYVQAAGQNLVNTGQNVLGGFLQPSDYAIAGFNPDQMAAFDLTRQAAANSLTMPYPDAYGSFNQGANLARTVPIQSYHAATSQGPATYTAREYVPAQAGPAAQATAHTVGKDNVERAAAERAVASLAAKEQLSPDEILPFMSPYIQGVIDPTVNNMRANAARTAADIGAKTAAANSFAGSGSRGALMQAQNNRALGEQVATTAATLMNQGYSQAQAAAMANAQMRNQVEMLNAQLGTDVSKTNATLGTNVSMFNAGQGNTVGMFDVGQQNQVGMFNTGQTNNMKMFDVGQMNQGLQFNAGAANTANQWNAGQSNAMQLADLGFINQANQFNTGAWNTGNMQNATAQNQLAMQLFGADQSALTTDQQRRLQMIAAVLGIGNQQQQTMQSALNVPVDYLKTLGAITPQDTSSSTTGVKTQVDNSPSTLQQLLGAGLTVAGMKTGGSGTVLSNLLK